MLPDIGSYRDDIQAWVSHYMGYPVVIQSIHADWRGWTPQLYLYDVTLLNQSGERAIAEFDKAYISFNPLRSLYHRGLIPESLVVSGVRLQLMRLEDGSILAVYPGLSPEQYDKYMANDELMRWLLSQSVIELQDARIDWFEQRHVHRPVNLQNANLRLRTDKERTQITGDAQLSRQLGKRLEFALDVEGDLFSSDWRGHIYIHGEELLPAGWPTYTRWNNVEIAAGRSDLKIWSKWENASLKSMSGTVSASDLLILGKNHSNLIHSANSNFKLERNGIHDGWHLHSNIRELLTHNGAWPATRLELKSDPGHGVLNGYADFLRIEDILPLIAPEDELARQSGISPYSSEMIYGAMESVQFSTLEKTGSWRVRADFRDVKLLNPEKNQSIAGLAGQADIHNKHGKVNLNSRSILFSNLSLFPEPITGLSAEGDISWIQTDDDISFRTADLNLGLSDFLLQLSGQLNVDSQNRVSADLIARTLNGDEIEVLKQLTPLTASDELRDWIDHALVSGRLQYADMVLRGDLDLFPFRQQEGQLKVHARFDDVTLDYDKNWPPIYHLEADLTLSRNKLTASIPAGRVYNARIHSTTAFIDTVFDAGSILSVTGSADGHARDALKFLNESPLRDDKQILRARELEADGEIALMLDMRIPLSPAPNEIHGKLELLGNHLISPNPKLELADVTGIVNFTSTSIESEQLRGKFHGENADLSIRRRSDAPDEATIMRMSGSVDSRMATEIAMAYMPEQAQHMDLIMNRLSGRATWDVEIHTFPAHQHIDSIAFASDLHGLSIDLPEPLGKPTNEARPFKLTLSTTRPDDELNHFQLDYGNILQAVAADGHASLYFGAEQPGVPDKSAQLVVRGAIPSLRLDAWINLFDENRAQIRDLQQTLQDSRGLEVDLRIDDLVMFDQHFPQSHIAFAQEQEDWLLSIIGNNMTGTLSIPQNLDKQPVRARFDKLHLNQPLDIDTKSDDPDLDPRTLPAFDIEIDDFIYGRTALGNLKLKAQKTPNGLLINEFSTQRPGLIINGRGDWHAINNEIISDFELELHAERFADMLLAFGYSVIAIEDGETNIEVTAMWPGAPMAFSLADMSGSLSLNIRKGQFLDIDPKAGRLFGLLSIQALPRRLSLDFADLFKKGLAFDQISGTFEIQDGDAYTNDLLMEGLASKVAISGRTGLVDQDYDQIVTVTPHISDSLPLASALFGPAGIGIGAIILIAGQVFEAIPEQIDKLLSFQYTMTGSWEDPVIEPYQPRERETSQQELGRIR